MKKIFNKYSIAATLLTTGAAIFLWSCQDAVLGPQPVLERVSLVEKDSTTESGFRGATYVIFGKNLATTQYVYFNEQAAALNTTMVQDNNIIVAIPSNAPYANGSNKIRVVTKYGEASLGFIVRQTPVINSFAPAVAAAGEIVTIKGNYFDNVDSVYFTDQKTKVKTKAEVVSATTTEIKVIVPADTKVSFISVKTPSGTTRATSSFGFNYIIYADAFNANWQNWSWSSDWDYSSTSVVKSGQYSYKQTYTGGWGGIQLYGGDLPLKDVNGDNLYEALKFSMYGGPGTTNKEIIVTINWAVQVRVTLKEGEWSDFTIPLSSFGNPDVINVLVFQDVGNTGPSAPYLMFIDDMGLI